ncbi:MAG: nitrilase-related carbon-nitrogen hydrolase, partial [Deltaproteobacteria bacterium]
MKIAAAQINPRVGDIKFNLALILKQIDLAKSKGVQLIVLPELAILGYPPRDLLSYSHLIDENLEALQKIKQHSQGISVVVGYVERNPSPLGKPYFNSAAVFQNRNLIKNYRKKLLPSYDVFEEERYFQPGELGAVFEIQNKKIGLTICEDVWNEPGFIEREYDLKPLEDFKDVDLDLLVNLSASPFQLGKKEIRDQLFQLVSKKIGCPVVFCNQVGANDELIFDGGSFVVAPHGKCVVAQDFQSELLIWDEGTQQPSVLLPLRTESQTLIEALSLGIRDYVEKSGARTVCLGLSGGIDSSVVAALAVKALGPNRVYGFTLPSRFNASQSLEDAEKLAANLGISCRNLA